MIYTITISNVYEYPINPVERENLYVDKLLCTSYGAYVEKKNNTTFAQYINMHISNIYIKVDKINPEYVQKGGSIELANGNNIDDKTSPPLIFSWWDENLNKSRLDIDGLILCEYNIHIVFSGESGDITAKNLKSLCDNFLTTHDPAGKGSASYRNLTKKDWLNYEGFLDKVVDIYQKMRIWKFNPPVADDFIKKVEKEYIPSNNFKSILITKLYNKL